MSVVRRFLVAPSLVRLIRKERGGSRITEGYFAPQGGRTSLVRLDGQQCHLVLLSTGTDGGTAEERTEVPRAHGEALLDVCAGKAAYDRTAVPLGGGREVLIDRYVTPTGLEVASVAFDDESASQGFSPPAWFGREVSSDEAYARHKVALDGAPAGGETNLSNAALDAVLDLLEPRFGLSRLGGASASPAPAPRPVPVAPPPPPVAEPVPEPAPEPSVAAAEPPSEPEAAESSVPEPVSETAESAEWAGSEPRANAEPQGGDSRIDDVIESLSQALGAAIQQPKEAAPPDELASSFERWTVRPRRTQQ